MEIPLALPLPSWNEIIDMDSEFAMNQDGLRQSKRDDEDVFSARCELDDAKTPISVGVVRRVDGDCSPCAARDVPILHWECCHNCEEFATEHPELLVTCRGCGQIPLGVSENASATYHLALQAKNRSTEIVESAIDARLDAEMRKGLDDLTCEAFKTSSGIFSGMSGVLKASSAKAMVSGMSGVLETTSAKAIVSGVSGVLETTSAKAIVSGVSGVADSFNLNGCVALDWLQTHSGLTGLLSLAPRKLDRHACQSHCLWCVCCIRNNACQTHCVWHVWCIELVSNTDGESLFAQ